MMELMYIDLPPGGISPVTKYWRVLRIRLFVVAAPTAGDKRQPLQGLQGRGIADNIAPVGKG